MDDVKNKQRQATECDQHDWKNEGEYFDQNFPWLRFTKFTDFYNVQYAIKQLPKNDGKNEEGQEGENSK